MNAKKFQVKSIWLLFCIFSLSAIIVHAQEEPIVVEVSKDKIILNGKIYYVHIVQEGQTLHSISKAYNVGVNDIIDENPSTEVVLRIGSPIKIPAIDLTTQLPDARKKEEFYYHQVQKGQTAYFLSNKYNTSLDVIYQYNPGSDTLIKEGAIIRIPKNRDNYTKKSFIQEDYQYYYYRVKRKDTFYQLMRTFKVSVEELKALNNDLEDGLKAGQLIRIPKRDILMADTYIDSSSVVVDTSKIPSPYKILNEIECDSLKLTIEEDYVDVALLMPFYSEYIYQMHQRIDTIQDKDEQKKYKLSFKSAYFIEFYQGFLLAAEDLKKQGKNINLYVFDTERDTLKIKGIINELSKIQPELIVGPAYPEMMHPVSEFALENKINIVSPFTSSTMFVESNPYLFQVVPSDSVQFHYFAKFVNGHTLNKARYIIHNGDSSNLDQVNFFIKELQEDFTDSIFIDSTNYHVMVFNDTITNFFEDTLEINRENAVIVISKDPTFINAVLSKVNILTDDYRVKLFGMPEWLKNDDGLDVEFVHNVELGVFTPFYFDITDEFTRRKLKLFNHIFGFTPDDVSNKGYTFATLGYDIGLQFLWAVSEYGKNFQCCMEHIENQYILSKYYFKKQRADQGFMNSSIFYIQYNGDYSITKLVLSSIPY